MKKKVIFAIGLTGVLAFTIGFVANLQNTQVSIEEKTIVASKQTNMTTVITKEEQYMVEKTFVKEGFVPQENGTGFFFIKEK
ncbi:hypothetical protein ABHM93_02425 [Micromonospora provocatoris]|uniref:hypothetical protein n=1 Tax=Micromonospora provocatoris TaxID=322610 RepID=UPI003D28C542